MLSLRVLFVVSGLNGNVTFREEERAKRGLVECIISRGVAPFFLFYMPYAASFLAGGISVNFERSKKSNALAGPGFS